MDPGQFQTILERQTELLQQLVQQQSHPPLPFNIGHQTTKEPHPFPLPKPLSFEGNMEDNFDLFVQSWEDYSKAIGMDHWPSEYNATRMSLLLAVIGDPAKNYNLSADELESPETALQAIRAKINRDVVADISAFFKAKQGYVESIDDFAARLKRLVPLTRLRTLESELITCKIVNSNKWHHLRTKMRTIADITMEQALELCRNEEVPSEPPWRVNHLHFLNTDFKRTALSSWISGFVSSKQETPNEFIQALTTTLMGYKSTAIDEGWIDECVKLVFEKAISQRDSSCSDDYAKLAKEMATSIWVSPSLPIVTFQRRLAGLCQEEVVGHCIDRITLGLNIFEVKLDEEKRKIQRAKGTIRFIGELYTYEVLTIKIVHTIIKVFLKKDNNEYDDETLRCLCQFLTTIGPKMEKDDGQKLSNYFQRMGEILRYVEQYKLYNHTWIVHDVIALRQHGWNLQWRRELMAKGIHPTYRMT